MPLYRVNSWERPATKTYCGYHYPRAARVKVLKAERAITAGHNSSKKMVDWWVFPDADRAQLTYLPDTVNICEEQRTKKPFIRSRNRTYAAFIPQDILGRGTLAVARGERASTCDESKETYITRGAPPRKGTNLGGNCKQLPRVGVFTRSTGRT